MKNRYKSFLRNYLISSSLFDFVFAYAVYNLLFNVRGLSVFQISILLAWWAFSAMILEIPSGALADFWSRKKILIIAPLIKSICFIIWTFADSNFFLYALGFLFWSIGSALKSGTDEALLFDKLKAFGSSNEYLKALSKKKFYFHLSVAVSLITGGFIANYNFDLVLILSVIPLILSSLFALMIEETPKIKSTGEIRYFDYIQTAVREINKNSILKFLFAYAVGISIFGGIEEFDQLYYNLAGLPIWAFGIAGFTWSAANALGTYFASKLENKHWTFYTIPMICAGLLLLVGLYPSIPMISALLLSYLMSSPLIILIDSKIQHNITSISRATVTSARSMLINMSGVILAPVVGLISKIWNLQAVYISFGIYLFFFSFWVFVNKKNFGK